jgi:RimJ/RimL family protein N-acetyltransferase
MPTQVSDPEVLARLFEPDRETHLYGLADLEEPFWSSSSWIRKGKAAVGIVSIDGQWVTGYAMSRIDPIATVELLAVVAADMPPGTLVTGPPGMSQALAPRPVKSLGPHLRLILEDLPAEKGSEAVGLGIDDLTALEDLHDSDPGRSFFLPTMLRHMPFVGIWDDGLLVASAGCHVASDTYGVAAVGAVITRPSHRGKGLGAAVISALCQRIRHRYGTIGLNVSAENAGALRLYQRLGFRQAFTYEEIELL